MKFLSEVASLNHFLLMLFIRGLNISLVTHVAVARNIYNSYSRLYLTLTKFF